MDIMAFLLFSICLIALIVGIKDDFDKSAKCANNALKYKYCDSAKTLIQKIDESNL